MDEAEFGYRKYLINMSNREQRDVMLEKLSELYQQGIKDDPSKLNVKRLLLALNYNLGKINTNIEYLIKEKEQSNG